MESIGATRNVDGLGRIVFPSEMRCMVGLNEGDALEIFIDDEVKQMMLCKYRAQDCIFCKSMEALTYFHERFICASCLKEFKATYEPRFMKPTSKTDAAMVTQSSSSVSVSKRRKKMKRKETKERLIEVMRVHPNATQKEWAELIGTYQSVVSQLIRQINK